MVAPHATTRVADALLRRPKTWDPTTTVDRARAAFADDHVHALLVLDGDRLLAVVTRDDVADAPGEDPAHEHGRLEGRVLRGGAADLEAMRQDMLATDRRRLAVVDDAGRLLGLLCLKRHGRGFCTDADVADRACHDET